MSWEVRHMELKVCFCNKTVLKTDITRFAPVWASYLLGLAMMVLLQFSGGSDDAAKASIVRDFNRLCVLGVGINGLYALVVVQALFGDLLNPRLCNALHAMPVTRDGYYGAHLIAGVLFALVPNCLVLLPTSLLLPRQIASVALLTLLALSLQYIFYLGTALTAVQLAGNRVGMVLIYGILNFATVLLYWFVAMVFIPLIYGKDISISWVARICPTVAMYEGNYFATVNHSYYIGDSYHYVFDGISMGDVWLKAAVCAGLGVVCMAIAQLLYRKRRLETAGDLVTYSILSPFFLALYTLTVAAFLHLAVKQLTQGAISEYFFLPLGLIAGYVTGLMLLRRTSRVFRWRLLVPLGGILAVCALCVLSIATDAFHVIRRVPDAQDVQSVVLAPVQMSYSNTTLTLTEKDEIEDILAYHQGALRNWQKQVGDCLLQRDGHWSPGDYYNIQLRYTLKNGSTFQRRYFLEKENPAYDRLKPYLSTPELSLGMDESTFRAAVANATSGDSYFYAVDGGAVADKGRKFTNFAGLANAVLADCQEGNLMTLALHTPTGRDTDLDYKIQGWLGILYDNEEQYLSINLTDKCTHTLYWISTHGTVSSAVG